MPACLCMPRCERHSCYHAQALVASHAPCPHPGGAHVVELRGCDRCLALRGAAGTRSARFVRISSWPHIVPTTGRLPLELQQPGSPPPPLPPQPLLHDGGLLGWARGRRSLLRPRDDLVAKAVGAGILRRWAHGPGAPNGSAVRIAAPTRVPATDTYLQADTAPR